MPHTTKVQQLEIDNKVYDIVVSKNWNQSDDTAVDFIENRTHYVIPKKDNIRGVEAKVVVPAGTKPFNHLTLNFNPKVNVGDWVLLETEVDDQVDGSEVTTKYSISKLIQVGSVDNTLEFIYDGSSTNKIIGKITVNANTSASGNHYISTKLEDQAGVVVSNKTLKYPIIITSVDISQVSAAYLPLDNESLGITADGKIATLRQSELRYAGTIKIKNDKYSIETDASDELLRVFLNEYKKAVPTTLLTTDNLKNPELQFHITAGHKRLAALITIQDYSDSFKNEFPTDDKVFIHNTTPGDQDEYLIRLDSSYSGYERVLDGLCFVAGPTCNTGFVTGDLDGQYELQPDDLIIILNGEPARLRSTISMPIRTGRTLTSLEGGSLDSSELKAISEGSLAYGTDNTAGLKGFYWSDIQTDSNTIVLSTVLNDAEGNIKFGKEQDFDIEDFWAVEDVISIHNDIKYLDACKITEIVNANTIKVDKLPFTTLQTEERDVTDFAVFVQNKPSAGLVDFGMGAAVFGEGNNVLNYMGFSGGYCNTVKGQYGTTFGKENNAGYCSFTAGKKNDNLSDHSIVCGEENVNDILATCSIINGKKNFNGGKRALIVGQGNKNNLGKLDPISHGYSAILTGVNNESDLNSSIVSGNANHDIKGENTILAGWKCSGYISDSIAAGTNLTFGDPSKNKYCVGSVISGQECSANSYNVVGGIKSKAYATGGAIIANESEIGPEGLDSAVFGKYNKTNFSRTFVAGSNNETKAQYQALVGVYSNPTIQTLFAVGNGTETDRSNALEVTKTSTIINGAAVLNSSLTVDGDTTINSDTTTTINGDISINGEYLSISSDTTTQIDGTTNINGDANLTEGLNVTGATSINGKTDISGPSTTINSDETAIKSAKTTISGITNLTGETTTIEGNTININGETTISGSKTTFSGVTTTISGENLLISEETTTKIEGNNLTISKGTTTKIEGTTTISGDTTIKGENLTISGDTTIVAGTGLVSSDTQDPVVLLGKYNIECSNSPLIIGAGEENSRKNAFRVDYDGNLYRNEQLIPYLVQDENTAGIRLDVNWNNSWAVNDVEAYVSSSDYTNSTGDIAALAFGLNNSANGKGAVAFGFGNVASGDASIVSGFGNVASGDASCAIGKDSKVEAIQGQDQPVAAVAVGLGTIANRTAQAVFGCYNKKNADALFIVGNGTGDSDSDRKSIFVIESDATSIANETKTPKLTATEISTDVININATSNKQSTFKNLQAENIKLINRGTLTCYDISAESTIESSAKVSAPEVNAGTIYTNSIHIKEDSSSKLSTFKDVELEELQAQNIKTNYIHTNETSASDASTFNYVKLSSLYAGTINAATINMVEGGTLTCYDIKAESTIKTDRDVSAETVSATEISASTVSANTINTDSIQIKENSSSGPSTFKSLKAENIEVISDGSIYSPNIGGGTATVGTVTVTTVDATNIKTNKLEVVEAIESCAVANISTLNVTTQAKIENIAPTSGEILVDGDLTVSDGYDLTVKTKLITNDLQASCFTTTEGTTPWFTYKPQIKVGDKTPVDIATMDDIEKLHNDIYGGSEAGSEASGQSLKDWILEQINNRVPAPTEEGQMLVAATVDGKLQWIATNRPSDLYLGEIED